MAGRFDHPEFDLQFNVETSQKDMYEPDLTYDSTGCAKKPRLCGVEKGYREQQQYGNTYLDTTDTGHLLAAEKLVDTHIHNDAGRNDNGTEHEEQQGEDKDINGEANNPISYSSQRYDNFSDVLRDLGQESKMVILQYSQVFGDCEAYEQQAIQAVEDLKGHARILLDNLTEQKRLLCVRLKAISEALTLSEKSQESKSSDF